MTKNRKTWVAMMAPDKNRVYGITDIAPDGRQTYFFVLTEPKKEQAFLKVLEANKPLNLTQYGRVIASGYGKPSKTILARLREKYDANI